MNVLWNEILELINNSSKKNKLNLTSPVIFLW